MNAPSVVEDLFLAALDKSTPQERAEFLDAACKDDVDTRRRVERLLEAHPRGHFLEPVPALCQEAATYVPTGEQVGTMIAEKYKLVEKIGEGGMGTVWVAQQTEPVKRVVAVKLIKAGMDSKAVLARFEAERQALALMEHPNIARVLDGGATSDGRPFFVMELVKGMPITQFCDARKLTPRQRLELFVPVCQAIQHAHQKGVIHRDIKPSNVLIAMYDDQPVPKVIDFGIAKAAGQTLTDKTLMTGFGSVVGTPEYMSPEQASLNNLDIDTRSDVYSLGVLLYELLAGSPPFHSDQLKKAGLLEMLRVVREVEPPRPSTKLSSANKLPSISADRGTEPTKLTGLLRHELDWIVMKALEKDRSRRYETVNGFAADVQRYLAGEAVQAHPPSVAYRLRKFAGKHRLVLATTAAFAGMLIVSAVISAKLAMKARWAESIADDRRIEAEENAKIAEANSQQAKQNAEWAEKNAGALSETSDQHFVTMIDAEIRGVAWKVDVDLAELRMDSKVGLLRLARPLNHTTHPYPLFGPNSYGTAQGDFAVQPKFIELREFATMAVLAAGQRFAPLLPPITHDGQPVTRTSLSPDRQTLLTLGKDHTARLWDTRTARPIAVLRKGDEKVVNCGFSPDGRTVFTDDQASVARLWDAPNGRFRATTEARPNRYDVADWQYGSSDRDACHISDNRLLTRRFVATKLDDRIMSHNVDWQGPVELWNTRTGRLVALLDSQDRSVEDFRFLGEQWVTTHGDRSTLLVFSAQDGRLLDRLSEPTGELLSPVGVSPTGRGIATLTQKPGGNLLREWDVQTWQAQSLTTVPGGKIRYWTDDTSNNGRSIFALEWTGGWTVYRAGRNEPIIQFPGANISCDHLGRVGDLVHGGNGWVCDTATWQRLVPPPGRRFHPDLAKFAADGRFVLAAINSDPVVIDTKTEKTLAVDCKSDYLPGFGIISAMTGDGAATIRLIPSASRLKLPVELLELWAQVAVRGELGAEGEFLKWDEATWEQRRQQLAAVPAPNPDLPFPGYVARDKLYWLRAEFHEAKTDADKQRIATDLLHRAEASGDHDEAARWRTKAKVDSTSAQEANR